MHNISDKFHGDMYKDDGKMIKEIYKILVQPFREINLDQVHPFLFFSRFMHPLAKIFMGRCITMMETLSKNLRGIKSTIWEIQSLQEFLEFL